MSFRRYAGLLMGIAQIVTSIGVPFALYLLQSRSAEVVYRLLPLYDLGIGKGAVQAIKLENVGTIPAKDLVLTIGKLSTEIEDIAVVYSDRTESECLREGSYSARCSQDMLAKHSNWMIRIRTIDPVPLDDSVVTVTFHDGSGMGRSEYVSVGFLAGTIERFGPYIVGLWFGSGLTLVGLWIWKRVQPP